MLTRLTSTLTSKYEREAEVPDFFSLKGDIGDVVPTLGCGGNPL